ncbi:MAG: GGDEF domain-containing protein [Acholeplasmatales bacterium]|nr:GGDEF domain-containing protein [Acholeplasmatales bacterium]
MEGSAYSVINLFCVLILSLLLIKTISDPNLVKNHKKIFALTIISQIGMYLADAFGNFIAIGLLPWGKVANSIIQFLYFASLSMTCLRTFLLLESINESSLYNNMKVRIIMSSLSILLTLVAFISMILSICGSSFHFLYYIDDVGGYHRGDFNFLQLVCTFSYLLLLLVQGLYGLIKKNNYARISTYKYMIIFVIPAMLGGILQLVVPQYPLLAMGITIATIIIYTHLLQEQVLVDFLTTIYNRKALYNYLQSKIKNFDNELYLIMIDLDNFKSINDIYGHVEGDSALRDFGILLNGLSKRTGCFVARYGGDEFTIVCDLSDSSPIDSFIDDLNNNIESLNDERKTNYNIAISYGYSKYGTEYSNIQQFIDSADQLLYLDKRTKKAGKDKKQLSK